MIAVFALCLFNVACSNNDEDENINYSSTAEVGSAGTYSGTWTRLYEGETTTYSGTITMAASGTTGVSTLTATCTDVDINITAPVNIAHANYGYSFVNNLATAFGTNGIAGHITDTDILTASFTLSQKVGKKNYEFVYSFEGKK